MKLHNNNSNTKDLSQIAQYRGHTKEGREAFTQK